ncbi:ATP-binding cassette domain-containing protein [Nonomuraea sp. NPDC050691]|uniref:ATP-binding cassette domain-containing protein n=1 Tax=Nonomuraea sp. NPDC050691 TaxID=3155661 RepID=UPI0033FC4421
MLEISGLRRTYESPNRTVEAIRSITFDVGAGELVCVVGPSGCGKTMLLRCVAGLPPVTGGRVRVAGVPVTGPPPRAAVVFQEYGRSLFPWMTVRENIELPLKESGCRPPGGPSWCTVRCTRPWTPRPGRTWRTSSLRSGGTSG